MRAVVQRKELAEALKLVLPASKSSANPGVRLQASAGMLDIDCNNLDLAISTSVSPLEIDGGSVVVPAELFGRLLGVMGDEVELVAKDGTLSMRSGDVDGELLTIEGDRWPRVAPIETDPIQLSSSDVATLRSVASCMGTDPSFPKYYGVHFEGDEMRAVNSPASLCATTSVSSMDATAVTVPTPTMRLVLASIDGGLELLLSGGRAEIRGAGVSWSSSVITEVHPPVRTFLAGFKPDQFVTVNAVAMRAALKRVLAIGFDMMPAINITIDQGLAVLECRRLDVGSVTDSVEVTGDSPGKLCFDAKLLSDFFEADGRDEVEWGIPSKFSEPTIATNGSLSQGLMRVRLP